MCAVAAVMALSGAPLSIAAASSVRLPPEEVSFRNGAVTLAGSLSLPYSAAARWPLAILISGDGPQTRDGVPGAGGLVTALRAALLDSGIAVLCHDDRGAGRSTVPAGPPSYRALLGDTRAAIAFARSRGGEIDRTRIVLIGHSEGAKTAAVIAAEDPRIAAIVLLAGATAVNVDSLLIEQARAMPEGPAPRLLALVEAARSGRRSRDPGDLTNWIREHLEITPRTVLARVRCPVLILQGEADHLVATHHAADAAAVLRAGGNRRVTVGTFPQLSHVFNRWAPGRGAPDDLPVGPDVPRALASWLHTILWAAPRQGGN